jgi:hypothetical protein
MELRRDRAVIDAMSTHRSRIVRSACSLVFALVPLCANAQPVCLDSRNMRDSTAVNGHTIMMSMIDGTRWRGTLTSECPGLRYNGFVIFPANSDYVCEGIQSIRIRQNHQVCRIGKKLPPRMISPPG